MIDKEIENIVNRIKIIKKPFQNQIYECTKCNDLGYVILKRNDGTEYAKECGCKKIKKQKERMEKSGILESDIKNIDDFKTFDNQNLKKLKLKAIDYCKNFNDFKNSILFFGGSGKGKTMLGLAISKKIMENYPVLYMPYREDIVKLKRMIIKDEYTGMINDYKSISVLFIDDLFKGKISESDINIMYEIINYRYTKKLPMIISTEKTIDELVEIDEAIAGRIVEMCRNYIMFFGNDIPNYRFLK